MRDSAFTLWCTGLSGAGKSTLCAAVARELERRGVRAAWLDGDEVRRELSAGLGFGRADRIENARRVAYVAHALNRYGVPVLVSLISPYREMRDVARARLSSFIEVYVRCSLTTCERRDPKALYARARRGEIPAFTGVSDPYEEPEHPDLVVDTDELGPEEAAERVVRYLEGAGYIPAPGMRRLHLEVPADEFSRLEAAASVAGIAGPESFVRLVAAEAATSLAPVGADRAEGGAAADDEVVLARLRDLGYIDA
ncbi:MAG: adenylyl-sulfate kinase [Firmicutes bacterium]|nr:adenylyl-sulfate kinase [Bacillota bacterium]